MKGSLIMKKTIAILVMLILVVSGLTACNSDAMADLPSGNKLSESLSPDGTYRMELYLCAQDGAMYVRGMLVTIESGESKNIYWAPYKDTLNVEWLDNTTIKIDGTSLNVTTDIFDCREAN